MLPGLDLISRAMNAYLGLDTESKARMKKLAGKVMTVELLPFRWIFQCRFTPDEVIVQSGDVLVAHATLRGTPLQMAGVMITKHHRHRFFAEDLVIEGDAELGQQVIALFDELYIDWEEFLARMVGDAPAHHAGRLVRRIGNWLRNADDSLTQNVNEYVHEEAAWFPTREALHDFFNDMDTLRMDVDRAEANIQRLRQLLTEGEESQ